MLDISNITKMECMDCVRSGALIVGVFALLLGSSRSTSKSKSRDRVGLWLLGESIGLGAVGVLLIGVPEVLLGHVTSGNLDPFHLFEARMLGTAIVGTAIASYLYIDSPNRDMWLLTRLLTSMALVISMAMAHSKPVKKGIKYSEQHLTFGLLAAVLWMLGTLCVLTRVRQPSYSGIKPNGLELSSRKQIHLLIDMMMSNWEVILCLAYPSFFLSEVATPDFKQDHLHAHLWRVSGVFLLSLLLISLINLYTNDRLDKRAYILSRLTIYILVCPLTLWYQWKYQMFAASMQTAAWTFNIGVLTNLAFALY